MLAMPAFFRHFLETFRHDANIHWPRMKQKASETPRSRAVLFMWEEGYFTHDQQYLKLDEWDGAMDFDNDRIRMRTARSSARRNGHDHAKLIPSNRNIFIPEN